MRTEKEVFEDFKKLGYIINKVNTIYYLYKIDFNSKQFFPFNMECRLIISCTKKEYYKEVGYNTFYNDNITLEEHKLLNELFMIWKWI